MTRRVAANCAGMFVLLALAIAWVGGCKPQPQRSGPAEDGAAYSDVPPPDSAWVSENAGAAPSQDEGTRRMVEDLQRIYREALENPRPYFHLNNVRADMLSQLVAAPGQSQEDVRLVYARELLSAGRTRLAIDELSKMIGDVRGGVTWKEKPLFDLLAVAYLRLGEQQNCLHHPSADACILP